MILDAGPEAEKLREQPVVGGDVRLAALVGRPPQAPAGQRSALQLPAASAS